MLSNAMERVEWGESQYIACCSAVHVHVPTHVVSVFIIYFQFELEQCDFEAREDLSTVKYF